MNSRRTNLVIGIVIGVLAAFLITALAILLVPRLRPIVGLGADTTESTTPTTTNVDDQNNATSASTGSISTESENISVTSPAPLDTLETPVTVAGSARVFENTVSIRLLDGDGTVLAEAVATAQASDVGRFGQFETEVAFGQTKYPHGTLEVFQVSARDGSEIDKVTLPIRFTTSAGI
ncbi:MAG: Gmad2 immunoglobulin-like domain-containing protein [Candidatus Andersenbacteria bacterium]